MNIRIITTAMVVASFFLLTGCVQNSTATNQFNKTSHTNSENVNGKILSQTNNVTVLKVWGTHKERGYAYGYLLGDKIRLVYNGYIGLVFKQHIAKAKEIIKSKQLLKIDEDYIDECKAIIEGMKAASFDTDGFDYLDLLVANSFLDLRAIVGSNTEPNGCSSFMAWGDATKNTELKGKSIITRNLDWSVSTKLIQNNIILIHVPSEKDEQPWLSIGYTGHCGALSGTNKTGLSIFQHMMYDKFRNKTLVNMNLFGFPFAKLLKKRITMVMDKMMF